MIKHKDSEDSYIKSEICEFCKKDKAIVNVVFKGGGLFNNNDQMNLCANCRDNLDDDTKILRVLQHKTI